MTDTRFVLPDSVIEVLHQLGSDNNVIQFMTGDLCRDVVDEFYREGGVITKGDIRRALALELGVEPSTVRDREYVCRYVPAKLREVYPILSYHQWRAISGVHDKSQVEAVAQWAVSQADGHGGRSASVLAIRRHLRDGGDDTPGWLRTWTRALDILDTVRSMEDAPNVVRTLAHLWVEKAKHISY